MQMQLDSAKWEATIMLWQQMERESENLQSAAMENTAGDGHLNVFQDPRAAPGSHPEHRR